tara:strand:+ start:10045 stop:10275 length:231 start_codon:yes stop_codon:yes gene_type:complete
MNNIDITQNQAVEVHTIDGGTICGEFVGFIKFGDKDSVVILNVDALDKDKQNIVPLSAVVAYVFLKAKSMPQKLIL